MEVHHHAHAHGKKNWKTYLWEFLMLFLAVFCGFLAEYQLEHYIEKQRAEDFAVSLQRDLVADTTFHNSTLAAFDICASKIDTLVALLGNTKEIEKNAADIYRLSVYAFIFPSSRANESTLQQLLNSGSLRYFKNSQLVDAIKVYNTNVQSLNTFNEAVANFNTEFRKEQVKIIEVNPMLNFIVRNNILGDKELKNDTSVVFFQNRKLLTLNEQEIKQYANWCALKKFYMANAASYTTRVKEYAIAVLKILNK